MTQEQQARLDRIALDDRRLATCFDSALDEIATATKTLDRIFASRAAINYERIAILKEQVNATQSD